jgi:TolA-binding protein
MPIPSEPLPDTGFDPLLFWDEHKGKVLLYGTLLIVALVGYAIYEIAKSHRIAEAGRAFAEAGSAADYRRVAERFPKSVAGGNAALALGGLLREEKKLEESEAALRKFLKDHSEHPLASSGLISLAATLEAQGRTDEALDVLRQVSTRYAASHDAPLAMILQAGILKARSRPEEARRAYEGVISQFPESIYAQQAMREMRSIQPAANSVPSPSPTAAASPASSPAGTATPVP